MPKHTVGAREEWSAARKELLEREQELGSLDEELAKQRQELPWVPVDFDFAITQEQMATGELAKMVAEADDRLKDWADNVGTDLAHGMAESPGWNVFALEDGVVYHTYSRAAPDRFLLAP